MTSFIPLKPEIAQKLLEQCVDKSETQQWAGEVFLVISQKKKQRYVLLTESCLYIFSKSRVRSSYDRETVLSIFDLISCSCSQEELKLIFKSSNGENVYLLNFPESGQLMTNLYRQYKYITWNVDVESVTGLNLIPDANSQLPPKSRPPHILLHRYVAASVSKSQDIDPTISSIINKYDSNPHKSIKFQRASIKSPTPLFFALSLEPNLSSIILEDFSPQNLGNIITWTFSNYNKLISITLKGYNSANFKGIHVKRNTYNHLNCLRINHCSTNFVIDFLMSMKQVTYSINTIIFKSVKPILTEQLMQIFRKCLENSTFLSGITTIGFIDLKCEISIISFIKNILESIELRQLIIENCGIDICNFMTMLSNTNNKLQRLSMRRNYGQEVMLRDDSLPENLIHLNVGDSNWIPNSLSSFLSTICRRSRKFPLVLELDKTHLTIPWDEFFNLLPLESFHPSITELNMSYNKFDSKSFNEFLRFLETQTPLTNENTQHKLMHLSISGCFSKEVEKCFTDFSNFFSTRELWGLSLCDVCTITNPDVMDSLIDMLFNIYGLTSINISSNYIQDSAAKKFLHFISESPTIAEVYIDKCEINDPEQMLWFYECLMLSPHILAFNSVIKDLIPFRHYDEVKRINNRLLRKRPFSTQHKRLYLYLTLYGDFQTRIINPPYKVNDHINDSLFDTAFINTVPSLFTLASRTTIDTSVDPLASMVTEYIATSGKYGIVPPTAPPPEAADRVFGLPSVFATMQMYIDEEPGLGVEMGTKLNELSKSLAEAFNTDGKRISVFASNKLESGNDMTTIPLIDFGK
ncbi:hypothetical protein GPJ56_001023 [Histomonas meleagridis]|uniref:uncharacterized protein n=1 Tax=Histomonas meleagridis TaxID=135588 RepID=UPI003559CCDE|nr:hypothetical protein GPJ56_001023 [Histomonas meleagridis]KAH0804664.1 hypothetical protein GO595_002529 [Histomonas meleagridis]